LFVESQFGEVEATININYHLEWIQSLQIFV